MSLEPIKKAQAKEEHTLFNLRHKPLVHEFAIARPRFTCRVQSFHFNITLCRLYPPNFGEFAGVAPLPTVYPIFIVSSLRPRQPSPAPMLSPSPLPTSAHVKTHGLPHAPAQPPARVGAGRLDTCLGLPAR